MEEAALALPAGRRGRDFAAAIQALGDWLQRRQDLLRRIQWGFVALYLFLLVAPALLPAGAGLPPLAKFAEILFWGLWWPGVILSMLIFGQFWCGLLCPDGTLTEFASRHGRAGKIPAWVRWPGWPLLLFAVVTVWEHLIDALRAPLPTLFLVGGTTLAATVTGFCLARGKRVWCRYLCPGSGIFSLLARAAIFHYRVDRAAWDAAPKPLPRAVDCPPLLDVRRLRSNEKCNMCGRCSGHRNAVALAARAPGSEIAGMGEDEARVWEALGICFVLIGLCHGAVYWQGGALSGWISAALAFVAGGGFPGHAAGAIGGHPLAVRLALMLSTALVVGAAVWALLLAGASGRRQRAALLAYSLIPLAGMGLFLAALEHGFHLLAEAGIEFAAGAAILRAVALGVGFVWSLALAAALVRRIESRPAPALGALVCQVVLLAALAALFWWSGTGH